MLQPSSSKVIITNLHPNVSQEDIKVRIGFINLIVSNIAAIQLKADYYKPSSKCSAGIYQGENWFY